MVAIFPLNWLIQRNVRIVHFSILSTIVARFAVAACLVKEEHQNEGFI